MKLTAAQRHLLKEGSAGVLDYGPSISGSPKHITQATPPGAPSHLGSGPDMPDKAQNPFDESDRAIAIIKDVAGTLSSGSPKAQDLAKALLDAVLLLKNTPSSI